MCLSRASTVNYPLNIPPDSGSSQRSIPASCGAMLACAMAVLLFLCCNAWSQQPPAQPEPDPESYPVAVQVILESAPSSPAELVQAIVLLSQFGYPTQARPYLEQLLAIELQDDDCRQLVEEIGSHRLIQLSRIEPLAPESQNLATQVLGRAARLARDPRQLDQQISLLRDPSVVQRRRATRAILAGGTEAMAYLVHVLADATRAADHSHVASVLRESGELAAGPLLASLESQNSRLQVAAIEMLGTITDPQAVLYLLAPSLVASDPEVERAARQAIQRLQGTEPSRSAAIALLETQISRTLATDRSLLDQATESITRWHWDAAASRPVSQVYSTADDRIVTAARLAADLYRIQPAIENRRTMLCTGLEAARLRVTWDQPLPPENLAIQTLLSTHDAHELVALVDRSLSAELTAAATECARHLSRIGAEGGSIAPGSRRPLVRALHQSDRRLRFAAMQAMLQTQTSWPFPGSSYVLEALAGFAASSDRPHVILGHPRLEASSRIAGLLQAEGWTAVLETTGREFVDAVRTNHSAGLLLVSAEIRFPSLREVLYQVRQQPSTTQLPIGVVTSTSDQTRAASIANGFPGTIVIIEPHDAEAIRFQIGQLEALRRTPLLPPEELHQYRHSALLSIGQLADSPQSLTDARLLEDAVLPALRVAELSSVAATTLGKLGTPSAQKALVDFVSQRSIPIALRQAAANEFRASVTRYGLLLQQTEILQQYDRYNASEQDDAETQAVLGSLLDTIEEPSAVRPQPVVRQVR